MLTGYLFTLTFSGKGFIIPSERRRYSTAFLKTFTLFSFEKRRFYISPISASLESKHQRNRNHWAKKRKPAAISSY
jgi:hypothetical protein